MKCLNRRRKAPPAGYILLIEFLGRPYTRGGVCCYFTLIKVRKKYFGKNFRADHCRQGGVWDPSRGLGLGAGNLYAQRRRRCQVRNMASRWCMVDAGDRGPGHGGWPGPRESPIISDYSARVGLRQPQALSPHGGTGGVTVRAGTARLHTYGNSSSPSTMALMRFAAKSG